MRRLRLAETQVTREHPQARVPLTAPLGPVHKTAAGIAVGCFCGVAFFALTVFHVVLRPADALDIGLLAQYFNGYEVSWKGAVIGLCWGFLSGFVAGWFVAFVRNVVIAIRVLMLKGRAELAQARDFLDHI
jgi:hypothetical protein